MFDPAGKRKPAVEAMGVPAEQADPPGADKARTSAGVRAAPSDQLVEELLASQRQVGRAQARLLRVVHRLAHCGAYPPRRSKSGRQAPYGFCGVEIAAALTWSQYTAEQALAVATLAIGVCPALLDDLVAGRLDWAKLKMFEQELREVEPTQVSTLVEALRSEFDRCTVAQLRERLRRILLEIDPEAARQRHAAAVGRRRVRHNEFATGTAALSAAYLPVERAAAAWDHVDSLARSMHAAGDPQRRELEQIRADVFADLLAGERPAAAGTGTTKPRSATINLHIDLTTLACLNDDPALIPGFGPVLADIARQTVEQVAQSAQWRFTVTENSEAIAEGRLRYRPTVAQKAFIVARDQTCRAPGCQRTARRCEVDHIRDWVKGGSTTVSNLCSLCRLHHHAKHAGGFQLRRTKHGIEWRTPLGRRYNVLANNAPAPEPTDLGGGSGPVAWRR
jgi:hypothetical protein